MSSVLQVVTVASIRLRVPIGDGNADFVEVAVDRRDVVGPVELNAGGNDVADAPFTLSQAWDRVLPAIGTILTKVRRAEHAPDEIAMEIGLKIGGEHGLVFAKVNGEATFQVTLTWRKPPGDSGPAGGSGSPHDPGPPGAS